MKKKLLITGGSGLVGSSLVRKLNIEYDILSPSHAELDLLENDKVRDYFSLHKPDACVHAAALVFGLGGNLDHPSDAIFTNSQIDLNVFKAAKEISLKRLVYVGTVASYPYPYKNLPLQENDFLLGEPHSGEYGYASAKRAAAAFCRILSKSGTTSSYAILTNVFGPNDRFNIENGHVLASLIAKASDAASKGEPLRVWGSPETTRDFMYVDGVTNSLHKLLNQSHDGLVNISTGLSVTLAQAAGLIAQAFGITDIIWESNKPQGIPHRVVSNSVLKSIIDFEDRNFELDLLETINWYKSMKQGARQ